MPSMGSGKLLRCGSAASVLLVLGAGLTVLGYRDRSFGWFAYAPLSEQTYGSATGLLVVGREEAVGLAVLVVGLVLAAGCVGARIGRRSASRAADDDAWGVCDHR